MKFINESTGEEILVKIIRIAHYPDVKTLLETEGTERTLSSGGNVEHGVNSINSLTEYEEMINKNGVLAFEIKLV